MRRWRAAFALAMLCAAPWVSAACDWPWRHDMANQPSPAAEQGPRQPAVRVLPRSESGPVDPAAGEFVANPVGADASVVESGRALYGIYCLPCHGLNGSGTDGAVAKYFPRVGDLRSADVQQHGDGWFYAVITLGAAAMPAYGHELETRERWQIVRFIRTLAR